MNLKLETPETEHSLVSHFEEYHAYKRQLSEHYEATRTIIGNLFGYSTSVSLAKAIVDRPGLPDTTHVVTIFSHGLTRMTMAQLSELQKDNAAGLQHTFAKAHYIYIPALEEQPAKLYFYSKIRGRCVENMEFNKIEEQFKNMFESCQFQVDILSDEQDLLILSDNQKFMADADQDILLDMMHQMNYIMEADKKLLELQKAFKNQEEVFKNYLEEREQDLKRNYFIPERPSQSTSTFFSQAPKTSDYSESKQAVSIISERDEEGQESATSCFYSVMSHPVTQIISLGFVIAGLFALDVAANCFTLVALLVSLAVAAVCLTVGLLGIIAGNTVPDNSDECCNVSCCC